MWVRKVIKKYKREVILCTIFVLLISRFVKSSYVSSRESVSSELEHGVYMLKELEEKDISKIQTKIDNMHREEELKKRREEIKKMVQEEKIDYKIIFKGDIFWGDSIVEALSEYEYLNNYSVVAKKGKDVLKAREDIDTIIKLSPERLFILLGMNDLLVFEDLSLFIDNYKVLIDRVREGSPNTKIYINSILPVMDKVSSKNPLFKKERIIEANKRLNELAINEGATFVDIRYIMEENKMLYEPDGIHVKSSFYPKWLNELIKYNLEGE